MRGGIRGGAEEGRRRRGEEDEVKEGAMATRQEIKSSARWSMNMPLAAAVFLFLALPVDPTRAPRHIPKFAFDKDESPVNIPLILKVILVDLGPGAEPPPFRLDKDEFERLLFQTMPEHQPRCAETGEKLHVAFEIFYDVIHASHADSSSLARVIKSSMRRTERFETHPTPAGAKKEVDGEEEAESKAVPVYDVIVEGDVQSELERIYEANSKSAKYDDSLHLHGKGVYSILILNMDKQAIAPDDVAHSRQASAHSLGSSYIYRYKMSHDSASGSDAFLTRSRFVVLDLASGPCLFGSSHSGEGTVTVNSLPRRYDVKWKETEEEKKGMIGSQLQRRSLRFQAELAQVVTSSIQYVFAPDVQFDELDFSEKLLVPILIFRNHRMYDPLEPGSPFSLDVAKIEQQIKSLAMPGQEVEIVTGLQSLLEHERIAMALNHAMRTDTVHESKHGRYLVRQKNYIDSTLLFRALAESSDYLASGLIAASPVLSQRFFPDFESEEEMHKQQKSRRWALGTRILPVFVFSLEEEWREDVLLFDNWLPYAASKDVVAVIQSGHSDSPVPFFSGSSYITMSLQNPTSNILAGVGAAIGGLMPMDQRFSSLHKKLESNYLWSHGFTPFGPFANSTGYGKIAIDHTLTNNYISRIGAAVKRVNDALLRMDDFADKLLFDPLGDGVEAKRRMTWLDRLQRKQQQEGELPLSYETVSKLHKDVLALEDMLSKGAEEMYNLDAKKTHDLSDDIFARASAFHAHAIRSLAAAERAYDCCSLKHDIIPRVRWNPLLRAFLLGFIAVCLVILVAFLNPPQRRRVKPVVR